MDFQAKSTVGKLAFILALFLVALGGIAGGNPLAETPERSPAQKAAACVEVDLTPDSVKDALKEAVSFRAVEDTEIERGQAEGSNYKKATQIFDALDQWGNIIMVAEVECVEKCGGQGCESTGCLPHATLLKCTACNCQPAVPEASCECLSCTKTVRRD